MRTLNLGILAHVDAGKTSITERLLYAAGVISEVGSVDDGSTQTDTLALERQRGITIKSAVVSFTIDDVTVNLIDTPGHPDFIAEVERVLDVLDGAVLVVSAVEGVQSQTRVLMRALRRLHVPTLVFVNKIDRVGAQYASILQSMSQRLAPDLIAMGWVSDRGSPTATFVPHTRADPGFISAMVDLLAEGSDALLATYVHNETAVSYQQLRSELAAQTKHGRVHPVYFGSAVTGAGVDSVMAGIRDLLPAVNADAGGPLSGTVFKVERGSAGEKIAYVRMYSGTLRIRDQLRSRRNVREKVTAISIFEGGAVLPSASIPAGRIGKVWGLGDIQIGDPIGTPQPTPERRFAPATLETVVVPRRRADRGALHLALSQLAEQDPLIDLRQDATRQETTVSLYGEVQKEVIQATLATDFDIEVTLRETTTLCIERLVGSGAALETLGQAPNPFLATVGLRVDPASVDSGVQFRLEVSPGSMPVAFTKAVEETVHEVLLQGRYGWRVADCLVTMTHSGYAARQSHSHAVFDKSMSSTAGDFRNLTPLVLMSALEQAGTQVCQPIQRFHLDIPAESFGAVMPALAASGAVPQPPVASGSAYLLDGDIPAARVHELELQLPVLTSGEGVLETVFDHYDPVAGEIPTRPRTDHNPRDRKEYLLRVSRRVRTQRPR